MILIMTDPVLKLVTGNPAKLFSINENQVIWKIIEEIF